VVLEVPFLQVMDCIHGGVFCGIWIHILEILALTSWSRNYIPFFQTHWELDLDSRSEKWRRYQA
jgi:hypothetical protein